MKGCFTVHNTTGPPYLACCAYSVNIFKEKQSSFLLRCNKRTTASSPTTVVPSAISRSMVEEGLPSRRPLRRLPLTQQHCQPIKDSEWIKKETRKEDMEINSRLLNYPLLKGKVGDKAPTINRCPTEGIGE
ncbi:hypothetical protein TNCV_2597001 [Trichonephila clavipes]|nr:hypothetical protein TNCV_2597001 [Trichonephila clavipes]